MEVKNKKKERQNKKKESRLVKYSLRELVGEITGVKPSSVQEQLSSISEKTIENRESEFEAAYQEVKRICVVWRKVVGNSGALVITDKNVKGFIFLTREMYFGGRARIQYEKIRKNEVLTDKEHKDVINILVEAQVIENGLSEEEEKQFRKKITLLEADDCWELGGKLRDIVIKDLQDVNSLRSYEYKSHLLEEYREIIEDGMKSWRLRLLVSTRLENGYIK